MIVYNNQAAISGKVLTELTLDHVYTGEKFYRFTLGVERTSGTVDKIPVVISERIIDTSKNYIDKPVQIIGQFRSYNDHSGVKTKLLLFIFALEIFFNNDNDNINNILLDGYICSSPTYRLTPYGREIADFTLAVPRAYGKSDYIPCISWNRNAKYISNLSPSTRIKICGRIQSRGYTKNEITYTAYELSVMSLEVIKEEA